MVQNPASCEGLSPKASSTGPGQCVQSSRGRVDRSAKYVWKRRERLWDSNSQTLLLIKQQQSSYFDTSLWEFLSPSKVKGDAPVRSSNIRMPRLHQSTDWRRKTPLKEANIRWLSWISYLHLAVSSFASDDFRGHVLDGSTEGVCPFLLKWTQ